MFTKTETVRYEEMAMQQGRLVTKKQHFSGNRWWRWQLWVLCVLWVAGLWSPDGCLRQTCPGVSPASSVFSSHFLNMFLNTFPGNLAVTLPHINNKREWNPEFRSQKILLFSLKEVKTEQYTEGGKTTFTSRSGHKPDFDLDISTL